MNVNTKIFVIFAMSFRMLKTDRVITWRWDTYILKAFSERFGFDEVRISQLRTDCQRQSNGNAPWRCRLYMLIVLSFSAWHYIYIGVGLSALLGFDNQGNARAFTS